MAAIALGLWANAAALWLKPAHAQEDSILFLRNIDSNIQALVRGGLGCTNRKVCD
jgi:hypothetical protein